MLLRTRIRSRCSAAGTSPRGVAGSPACIGPGSPSNRASTSAAMSWPMMMRVSLLGTTMNLHASKVTGFRNACRTTADARVISVSASIEEWGFSSPRIHESRSVSARKHAACCNVCVVGVCLSTSTISSGCSPLRRSDAVVM